jgi:hypothetical protein
MIGFKTKMKKLESSQRNMMKYYTKGLIRKLNVLMKILNYVGIDMEIIRLNRICES